MQLKLLSFFLDWSPTLEDLLSEDDSKERFLNEIALSFSIDQFDSSRAAILREKGADEKQEKISLFLGPHVITDMVSFSDSFIDEFGSPSDIQTREIDSLSEQCKFLLATGSWTNLCSFAEEERFFPSLMVGCSRQLVSFLDEHLETDILSVGAGECLLEWALAGTKRRRPRTVRCLDLSLPQLSSALCAARQTLSFCSLPSVSDPVPFFPAVRGLLFVFLWGAPWRDYLRVYHESITSVTFISPFDDIREPVVDTVLTFLDQLSGAKEGAWRCSVERRSFEKKWLPRTPDVLFIFEKKLK